MPKKFESQPEETPEQTKSEIEEAPVEITAYSGEHKDAIVKLVNDVYENELGHHSESGRPDLRQIPEIYQENGGNFWVALDNGKVVGTIALINEGGQRASLHRFCVGKEFRGKKGVSKKLFGTMMGFAKEKDYKKLFLSTWSEDSAAGKFYNKNGFKKIEALPEDMAGRSYFRHDKAFYKLELSGETK